jgi:hypothetical protein
MAEEVIKSTPKKEELIKALDVSKYPEQDNSAETSPSPILLNELSDEMKNSPQIVVEEQPVEIKISGKKKRLIRMVKGAAGIKSKPKPFLPENSLSAIERYFHHMPDESAQV